MERHGHTGSYQILASITIPPHLQCQPGKNLMIPSLSLSVFYLGFSQENAILAKQKRLPIRAAVPYRGINSIIP